MRKIRAGVVTYNEDGRILKREDTSIHLYEESAGHGIEVFLPDKQPGVHYAVHIPLCKLLSELKRVGVTKIAKVELERRHEVDKVLRGIAKSQRDALKSKIVVRSRTK